MTPIADATSRIKRPEYTGENRCMPCTVVNVLVALAVAVGLAVISPVVGVLALLVSLLAIYFRGYLVPGTPEITERYFPAPLLRLFGKEAPSADVTIAEDAGTNETLAAAGILVRGSDGACRLAPWFREEWHERIRAVREREVETEDVATLFGADELDRHGETSFVLERTTSLRWESRAALVADVAADRPLRSAFDDWDAIDAGTRRDLLRRLRLLLERCPRCDGAVATVQEHADPCCQPPFTVVESVCRDCNVMLAAIDVPDSRAEPWRELGVLGEQP